MFSALGAPRSAFLIPLFVLLLAVGPGCTRRNPYKCNAADPCPLTEAPYCDINGDFGERFRCIPSPFGGSDGGLDAGTDGGDGGAAFAAQLDRTVADFGTVLVGSASPHLLVNLSNVGSAPGGPLHLAIEGTNRNEFAIGVTNDCEGATLLVGAGCAFGLVLSPAVAGAKTSTLSVMIGTTTVATLPLQGNGIDQGALRGSPGTLNLGVVQVGQEATMSISLMNTGGTTLSSLTGTFSGSAAPEFQLTQPDTCSGQTLGAGGSCMAGVRFRPTVAGAKVASLTFMASPAGASATSLEGIGAATLTVSTGGTGSGSVVSSPLGINCGAVCSASFQTSQVTLSAVPGANSDITSWTGCDSNPTATTCLVTMNGTRSVRADFTVRTFVLTVTMAGSGAGTVTSTPAGLSCQTGTCMASFVAGTSVSLAAKSTSGSYFPSWTGDCVGSNRVCPLVLDRAKSAVATFAALQNNIVFVSSMDFPANLGGLTAYDAQCNLLATAAGLNNAGGNGYVAWMSSETQSAASRVGAARGFVRPDGRPFADDLASLLTNGAVLNPIAIDENGRLLSRQAQEGGVWTGTNPDGSVNAGETCASWTSNVSTSRTRQGEAHSGPGDWTQVGGTGGCDASGRIYCMMRTSTAPLTNTPTPGKKVFVSNALLTVGQGAGVATTICMNERPGATGTYRAALPTTTPLATLASFFTAGTTYVRPDGQVVGTGAQFASGGDLQSGVWQLGDGTYRSPYGMWTGAGPPSTVPTAANTCNNWTDPAAGGVVTIGCANSSSWWYACGAPGCGGLSRAVYCVEQ
ncbi:MAG: choice-of-anchor D domain-containing protein [Deltaproteobacteria bacterium]|nr:choice-of-anchor D domain-containing protein [Deltaproteobacteria bacterium]